MDSDICRSLFHAPFPKLGVNTLLYSYYTTEDPEAQPDLL